MDIDTPASAAAADGAIEAIKPEAGTLKREIGRRAESAVQREEEEEEEEAERVVKKLKVESKSDGGVAKQEEDGRKKGVAAIKAEYGQFLLMVHH